MARKPAAESVNRDDIILAAADVLHRNGYEATTMKDIAAEVKLTAASLYHHFRNKDTLVLAVLEAGIDHVIHLLEPIVESDKPNAEKIAAMVDIHVVNLTQNTAVGAAMIFEIRSLMSDTANANQEFTKRRAAFFKRRDYFESLFRRVITEGVESGEFRQVDEAIFTRMMMGANNWVAVWYREGGRLDGAAIATMMSESFLRGLKP